jgi:methylthioribose-1-phosphate isomerase
MTQDSDGTKSLELLVTVAWKDGSVIMIDQTKLPNKLAYFKCNNFNDVAYAIKNLVIRGAPAIGVAAALGLALAATQSKAKTVSELMSDLNTSYSNQSPLGIRAYHGKGKRWKDS